MSLEKTRGIELYLDLLKKTLTNNIFAVEPDTDRKNEAAFASAFLRHYINGPAISMLPIARLNNLQECVESVVKRDVPGDLIEAGVWRGGAAIFMRAVLKVLDVDSRTVWVADSFEGLPAPDPEKYPLEAKAHSSPIMKQSFKHLAASVEEVRRNFIAFGMLDERVKFLQGWFKDTLPTAPIDRVAVMRLDGDYYESTMDCLVHLYDKLSVGGYAIIDDYGEDNWTYCRKAVDDFRRDRRIADPLIPVDAKCYYWQRTS
jgi:hypothetical protein